MCIRDGSRVVVWLLFLAPAFVCTGQEFRSTAIVTGQHQTVEVDLTSVTATDAASITIRNSSKNTIRFPQIGLPNSVWPYDIEQIKKVLPTGVSDQELAIATWRYVVDHMFHYCSAGTTSNKVLNFETDPIVLINGFGFGCCDQSDRVLVWIWKQLGYKTRLASMYAHTVPEIYYGGTWHMLDPDHRSYYLRDDGTIASIADILADPQIVVRQSNDGLDGIGWQAETMAQLYAENAPTLVYLESGYLKNRELDVYLRPNEQLTIHSENLAGASHFYDSGDPFSFKNVGSGAFLWDLSFADPRWKSWTSKEASVHIVTDETGRKYLAAQGGTAGSIVYRNSSMFPVLSLSVFAQTSSQAGTLWVSISSDGTIWSPAVQLVRTSNESSFNRAATLGGIVSGAYTYFVKVELSPGAELERLRIEPLVQLSKSLVPALKPGKTNALIYSDGSALEETRKLRITTAVPIGSPQIPGLQSTSRVRESATYSLGRGYGAANLVDQNPDTLAYPGSRRIDYQIDLNGLRRINSASIDWGYFGTDDRYIANWSLLGSVDGENWTYLAGGGFPAAETTRVTLHGLATSLRLVANGHNNVGAYDLRLFGHEVPKLPNAQLSAASLKHPSTFRATKYPAANLFDEDPTTVAFEWSKNLDYKISLRESTQLSAAIINWGYFGQNPAYISSWSLLGRNAPTDSWTVLAQGQYPNQATTGVMTNSQVRELRLKANSTRNFVGVFELKLYGLPANASQDVLASEAISNQVEANSVTSYAASSQLVDGSDGTFAYPGSNSPDYTLDFHGEVYVDTVSVNWGMFGTDPLYINQWRLLGLRTGSSTWELVARGGFPESDITGIEVANGYRKLRVAADSKTSHIGIFEVEVFGVPLSRRPQQHLNRPRRHPKNLQIPPTGKQPAGQLLLKRKLLFSPLP
jgi:hypothetical protein